MRKTINILGVHIDCLTQGQALDTLSGFLDTPTTDIVFTPNSEIIYAAYKDAQFRDRLNSASLNTADGIGVVYASKILGKPLAERVAGFDLMCAFMGVCAKKGARVFLFGSKEGVGKEAADELVRRYPDLNICGIRNGYFTAADTEDIIAQMNAAKPDVILVCLGAPKQENWIFDNAPRLNAKIMMGCGGSLDVLAGKVERAPESWQKLGLEWAYRLKKEPKRIGRMMALPKFAWTVLLHGRKYKEN